MRSFGSGVGEGVCFSPDIHGMPGKPTGLPIKPILGMIHKIWFHIVRNRIKYFELCARGVRLNPWNGIKATKIKVTDCTGGTKDVPARQ